MRRLFSSVATSPRKPASLDQLLQSSHELLTNYRTGRLEDARNAASLIKSLMEHGHSPVAVNTSLDLLFKSHVKPQIANEVLKHWRDLSKIKPRLTLSYDTVVSKFPKSSHDDVTATILLDSVLHHKGLEAAEEIVSSGKPTLYALNKLLKAYVETNAVEKVEHLLSTDLAPEKRNKFTVSIMLSHYSKRALYKEAKEMMLQHSNMDLDTTMYAQLVSIHAHQNEFEEAINIVHSKLMKSRNLGMAAQYILRAFRKQLAECTRSERGEIADKAKEFYASIETEIKGDPESRDKLLGTLLDTFTFVRREQDVQDTFSEVGNLNVIHYGIMMKHYKQQNQPDRALALLKQILENDNDVKISISLFNAVLDAWASSSLPNQIAHALETYQLLLSHPKCEIVGLKPDIATFGCLVRFFAAAGKSAEPLLKTMKAFDITPDNPILASTAVSCLKAGDLVACERVLAQMGSLGINAYQTIANRAFPDGISLETANETTDVFFRNEYQFTQPFVLNMVLAVWSLVKSHHRYSAMHKILKRANSPTDGRTYSIVIVTLSTSRKLQDVALAEELAMRSHLTKSAFVHIRNGYLRLSQPSRAARLLALEHDAGVLPKAFDVFTVVKGYTALGQLDEAFALVEDMKRLMPDLPFPKNAMKHLTELDPDRAAKLTSAFQTVENDLKGN